MLRARWFWDELAPMREGAKRRVAQYTPARIGDLMMRRLHAIGASLKSPTAVPG